MPCYRITALKDITVSAHIVFQTLRPLPQGNHGESKGSARVIKYRPETFPLPKGATRDDVASVIGVTDGPHQPVRETIPDLAPGATTRLHDLLLLERLE